MLKFQGKKSTKSWLLPRISRDGDDDEHPNRIERYSLPFPGARPTVAAGSCQRFFDGSCRRRRLRRRAARPLARQLTTPERRCWVPGSAPARPARRPLGYRGTARCRTWWRASCSSCPHCRQPIRRYRHAHPPPTHTYRLQDAAALRTPRLPDRPGVSHHPRLTLPLPACTPRCPSLPTTQVVTAATDDLTWPGHQLPAHSSSSNHGFLNLKADSWRPPVDVSAPVAHICARMRCMQYTLWRRQGLGMHGNRRVTTHDNGPDSE